MTWLVVQTKKGEEVRMYRAILDMGIADDAWLPTTLVLIRPSRRHASGMMREQWRCVLPRIFFASISPEKQHHLAYLREPTVIVRDAGGCPITVPAGQVAHYRAALDAENRDRSVIASRINSGDPWRAKRASWLPDSPKKKTPSRRLKNAGKVASEITGWKDRLGGAG